MTIVILTVLPLYYAPLIFLVFLFIYFGIYFEALNILFPKLSGWKYFFPLIITLPLVLIEKNIPSSFYGIVSLIVVLYMLSAVLLQKFDRFLVLFVLLCAPWAFVHVVMVSEHPKLVSQYYFLSIFFVWTYDTMAYLIGSLLGHTPFFPKLSPSKTWEGTIGGVVCAGVVGYIFGAYFYPSLSPMFLMLTGILIGISCIFGDLFESMIKRKSNVKDSGSIIPGHGGIWDRYDSYILAMATFSILILVFQNIF